MSLLEKQQMLFCLFVCFLCIDQAGLELREYTCLCLLIAWIKGMYYHA